MESCQTGEHAELPIVGATYRHFKGNSYVVTEVDEANAVVHYIDSMAKPWNRELREFFEYIERDEYAGPRFSLIRNQAEERSGCPCTVVNPCSDAADTEALSSDMTPRE